MKSFSTNEIIKKSALLRHPAVRFALLSAAIFSMAVAWEFILEPLIFADAKYDSNSDLALKMRFIIEICVFSILGLALLMFDRTHLLFSPDFANIKNLNAVITMVNIPVVGIDLKGNIIQWNKFTELITGRTADEVIGLNLVENFISRDNKDIIDRLLNGVLNGREVINFEYTIKNTKGDSVNLLLNAIPLRDALKNINGVLIVGQDISELKQTQARVIQASKLSSLGELATSVAHELNQPLSTIRMAVSNISDCHKQGECSPSYLENKLQRIQEQVDRASAITDHMRMFGRIADDDITPLDPRILMANAIDLVKEQCRLADIEVSAGCDHDCPNILANQIQLEQVFLNLLNNARDAIEENSKNTTRKISVKGTAVANNHLAISISDTGGGIPENILQKIFDPFVTTKNLGKGTGLGLSISYGILRDMNGTITAENIDDGARFTITLPLAEEPALTDLTDSPRAISDVM